MEEMDYTPEHREAGKALRASLRAFGEADEALANCEDDDLGVRTLEYLTARSVHQERIRDAERLYAPLMGDESA